MMMLSVPGERSRLTPPSTLEQQNPAPNAWPLVGPTKAQDPIKVAYFAIKCMALINREAFGLDTNRSDQGVLPRGITRSPAPSSRAPKHPALS
jgi:hypothetical protein